MFTRFASRGIAALVAGLLVVGSVTATAPAFAAEPATAAPTATAPATSTKFVTLTGSVAEIADEEGAVVKLFRIVGQGYLYIDLSNVTIDAGGSAAINVEVPADLDLGDTNESKFAALSAYSADGGQLVASKVSQAPGSFDVTRGVAEMVNQTPVTTAVHKVFAVLVTPSNLAGTSVDADQTAAKVSNAVAHTSTYWSEQSGGKISFALQGTVPWYKSAYSCETSTTAYQMWAEAATKATQQIGYVDAYNNHLVLFFPQTVGTACSSGAIGLATIGTSTNSGGLVWVAGTDSNIGKSTLSHELGHNLTYGHANWADCDTATPQPGIDGTTGCTIKNYGDVLDVMGFGISQFTGGSLSSAHAIRSGIWDDNAFAIASNNTTTSYTLNSVNSNSGLRSVVVEDDLGVNYFVEFRNYTGSDAQYDPYKANSCNTSYCIPTQSGVRILRLKTNTISGGLKGAYGDDAYLVGRIVGGVKRVNYTTGESFSTAGISITVSSISATQATVSVVRPAGTVTTGGSSTPVTVVRSLATQPGYNGFFPGDTATAMVASSWKADDYTFQWYGFENNARVAKPGETGQSYKILPTDVGKAFSVVVTGVGGGSPVSVTVPDPMYSGYAINQGIVTAGTATISNATSALTVVTSGWTSGTTFTYQWYRGAAAISGATAQGYTPTVADRGSLLKATVVGTLTGYNTTSATTPAKDYSVNATGTFAITGGTTVGSVLTANESLTYTTVDGAATINSRSYEWMRDGVTISGATASTYTVAAADIGKAISVKLTAGATGYIAYPATSAATAVITAAAGVAGTVTISNTTDVLTATTSGWATGTTFGYQWYRGTTAISGATSIGYTPTSADRAWALKVEVTGTTPGYSPVTAVSAAKDYSLVATGNVTISGATTVGSTLTLNDGQTYSTADGTKPIASRSYEWSRDGVIISGATSSTYVTVAADAGKLIFAKLTSRATGYIPLTTASGPTGTITIPTKTPGAATVSVSGFDLTVATSGWDSGTTFTYQWYRESDVIAGATTSSYTPSQTADRGYAFKVAVTGTQPGFAPATRTTALTDYNAYAYGTIAISGTPAVGSSLGFTESMNYTYGQPANRTYQWYANAVAISGATASTYSPVAADVDKSITVRVVANFTGYLSHATTSAGSDAVAAAPQTAGTVTITNTTNALTAVTSGWDSNATLSYQWFRGATAISGATASTYTPVQADRGNALKVEVTATRSGYTTVSASSPAKDYSLTATGSVTLTGTVTNGSTLTVVDGQTYTTADGTKPIASRSYEWFRDGTTIASAAASTYALTSADVGKVITAKVTSRATGYIALTTTSTATAAVAPGTKAAGTVTISNTTDVLTAVPAGWDSGTTYTYKWFRGATAISGATASTYTPVQADRGNTLKVEATGTQPGYVAVAATSAAKDYSLTATGSVTLTGSTTVGSTLTVADGQTYTTADGSKTIASRTYLWYRDGVLISSATAATYTLVTADLGKAITAQLTSTATGYIALSTVSTATAAVTVPTKAPGTATISNTTDVLTAVTAGWDTGTTFTYQWFRGETAISGETASTYTPVQADRGNTLKVVVVGTQPGFQPASATSAAKDYSLTATGAVTLTGTAANASTLTIADGQTYTTSDGSKTVSRSYEWFRDGTAIASATAATYTLTNSDIGKVITAKVTSRATGYIALTTTSSPSATVTAGTKAAGTVTISNATSALTAVTAGWDSGTTFTYKWFRGATAISGATASSYTPVEADRGNAIKVEATGTQPGFVAAAASSTAKDYSLNATGTLEVTGSATVGSALALAQSLTYTTVDGAATVTGRSYQWYRDGTAIGSATGSTYTVVTADLGAAITAKVTATATGYIAHSKVSTATAAVTLPSKAPGTATISNVTDVLTVVTAGWDTGTTFTYQWYRGAVAISGETTKFYTATSTDRDKALKVEVTGTQPGFLAASTFTAAKDYSVNATGSIVIGGTAAVGATLSITDGLTYTTVDGAATISARSYQWYRDGGAIASATASTYTVVLADLGKNITVKKISSATGYIAYSATTPATAAVVAGTKSAGTATISNATNALTVVTAGWDSGTTFTYKWFRGATAISGATGASYTPTSADRDTTLKAEVTGTQPGYVAVATFTPARDYSLNATGSLVIVGSATVGQALGLSDSLDYFTTPGGAASLSSRSYVWLRDGEAIDGANGQEYILVAADLGTQITARLTATATGFIAHTATTSATDAVVLPTLTAGSATISNVTDELEVVTSNWEEGTSFEYQWFRGASEIDGETTAFYTPTGADRGEQLKVKVTGALPGFLPVSMFTAAKDFSITATGLIEIEGEPTVGETLTVRSYLVYATIDGSPELSSTSYVWLRDGDIIDGATGTQYTLVSADLGAQITARLTVTSTGWISHSATTEATSTVVDEENVPGTATISNETDVLTVVTDGWDEGTTFTYRWFSNDEPIVSQTTKYYTPTASSRGKELKVEVTGTEPGYAAAAVFTPAKDYSLNATGGFVLEGNANVGAVLTISDSLEYSTADGEANIRVREYRWLRGTTAIAGATGATYKLATADLGKLITAELVTRSTGYIAYKVTTPATAKVTAAAFTSAEVTKVGLALTAVPTWKGTVPSGTKYTYQWYRGATAIKNATKVKYTLTSSDVAKDIKVKITAKKTGLKTVVKTSAGVNYTVTATPKVPTFTGTVAVNNTLTLDDREYTYEGNETITWLRNGKAIADQTAREYTLTDADLGAVISVKIVAWADSYLSSTSTSVATQKVGLNAFVPDEAATLIHGETLDLTVDAGLAESDADATLTYQWLRDGTAISKAVKATYKLTATDFNKKISVRVTATKPTFTPMVLVSDAQNYSVAATGTVKINNTKPARNKVLTATYAGFEPDATISYQWYANGKAITSKGTGSTFKVPSTYKGKVITVKVTAAVPGLLSYVKSSAKTAKVK